MVSTGKLQSEMQDAFKLMKDLGHVGALLDGHELVKFGRAFERSFMLHWMTKDYVDIYLKHRGEIFIGAMIAKAQMEMELDGEQPAPGKFAGPIPIRAVFFGVGDDWPDIYGIYSAAQNSWSTGSPQDWIHSGTSLLAGTDGNSIKILQNAVHVIIGLGTYHSSPKIESYRFEIDNKVKPTHLVQRLNVGSSGIKARIKELDGALIVKRNTTLKCKVFISNAWGGPSDYQQDYPYLVGASFVTEDVLRIHDPADIPGTTVGAITTT